MSDVLQALRGKMAEEELARRIEDVRKEFHGLLDERAAALLIADELGLCVSEITKISDLKEGAIVSVEGVIKSIGPLREFKKKSGETGRVVNITLADGTGECLVPLWDEDTDMVKSGVLVNGMRVRAAGCTVKRTKYGLELSFGSGGTVVPL